VVTDAALGNADAMAVVKAAIDAAKKAGEEDAIQNGVTGSAKQGLAADANKLGGALDGTNKKLQDGVQGNKDLAAATATTTAAVPQFTAAQEALAAKVGTTAAALDAATKGQDTTATAAANAAAKMYIENDAAGILKGSLDILNGKALSLMEAQTRDAAATNTAAEALKKNNLAIDGNSAAAIANQQALQAKASASQAEAEAVGKATGSTYEAVKAYGASKAALEASLKAQGLLTPAVQAYIDKLYQVSNLKVEPTKLDIDKAAADAKLAALQAYIDSIKQGQVPGLSADSASAVATIASLQAKIDAMHGKTIPIVISYSTSGSLTAAKASVSLLPSPFASGGLIGRQRVRCADRTGIRR
jgi:hypothetical protein